ncbi:Putative intracellular protease/amidase [Burkholderia sp. GAS332]|nr:Putative intracellular protease/amidase [Burkholderia sp. GAS332]
MTAKDLKALIVLTSHERMGETNRKTGFWYNEMAGPYWALVDAGFSVDIASIKGGAAPYDPEGISDGVRSPASSRFLLDTASVAKIQHSLPVDAADPLAYAVVVLPGGYGTMWDLAQSDALSELVGSAYDNQAIIGAICHGHAGLVGARRADGKPLVEGLRICSFTNAEEEAVGLTQVVPYLLETRLRELGGKFESAPNFQPKAVRDGRLVTGQNAQSIAVFVEALLRAISAAQPLGTATAQQ